MGKKNLIIDGHSHIGNDYYRGLINVKNYVEFAKYIGIDAAILMPVPNPILDGQKKFKCFYKDNKLHYFPKSNAFEYANYKCYEEIIKNDSQELKLFFAPLLNPHIDEIKYLEKMTYETNPVAYKIHGTANGVDPYLINEDFIRFVKLQTKPLIIHTHYDKNINNYNEATKYIYRANHPIKWANFLEKNKIHGILNHGACLDLETIDIINKSKYIKIGLGPDFVIENNPQKLVLSNEIINNKGYLLLLKDLVKTDKIIFDIDYNWNNSDSLSIQRIKRVWSNIDDQKQIFENNIIGICNDISKRLVLKKPKL